MRLIYFKKLWKDQAGSALLGLIVTMVFLSALAGAMIVQTTTGSLGFVNENYSLRAYYLAESGFRYAAAKLKHSGESALDTLHNHDGDGDGIGDGIYPLGDHKSFTIKFKTFLFEITGGDGTSELVTKVPFGDASSLADASAKSPLESGQYFYVKTKSGSPAKAVKSIVIQDSGGTPDPNGEYVKFIKDSGNWSVTEGTRVKLVVKSNGDDVAAEGGNVNLQATSQVEAFPLYNGRFEAQGKTYSYKQRGTDKLVGIYCVSDGGCSWPLSLTDGEEIILQDFTILHSIGTYVETSREIVYNIPVSTSEKAEFHDTFEDKSHWDASTLGSHAIIDTPGGDSALKVTGRESIDGSDEGSLIKLDWSSTNVDLKRAHSTSGNFLSYDAQVKVGFEPSVPGTYMAGMSFRQDAVAAGNSYGVSFLKGKNPDMIPDEFVPPDKDNIPLIVLWQQTSGGGSKKWLAYKDLNGPVFFFDDMERGEAKWIKEGDWTRFKTDSYSGIRCWHDSPIGDYLNNIDISLKTFKTIDLSGASSAVLSFWHKYDIQPKDPDSGEWYDWGSVDISTDDGTNWTELIKYEGSQGLWTSKVFDISSYLPSASVKIRFLLHTNGSVVRDGWYIDDVKISGVVDFPINEATLMVRVKEAATVSFISGGAIPIEVGDSVTQINGASGTVIETPILESGGWNGTAAGTILLNKLPRNIDGTITTPFASGDLNVNGVKRATANSFRARDNYIRVYYGDKNGYGIPDGQWLDYDKHGNPRGELHWPPDELEDWSADNDFFTLVQWNEVNSTVSSLHKISSLDEPDAILRTNELTTPTTGTFTDTDTEIGLHTFGVNSTSVYFDDFGLQTDVPTSEGFLPAIQQ